MVTRSHLNSSLRFAENAEAGGATIFNLTRVRGNIGTVEAQGLGTAIGQLTGRVAQMAVLTSKELLRKEPDAS